MPFDLTWEPGGVVRRYTGDVTEAERRCSFERICADPRFDSLRFVITNFVGATRVQVSPGFTEELAAMHIGPLATNPHLVMAAVALDPAVIAAIAHFKSLGFVDAPYRVFATEDDARAWLATLPRFAWR